MNTKHAHLSEAIAAATQAVGGKLSPDKTNQEQKYDYLSADLILSVGGQALAENGVMLLPSVTDELMTVVDRPNKSPRYDAKVNLAFALTYADQSLAIPWIGRGSDYSVPDKALYKAITSGHKYFLMKLLNIGAGNEDGEHETDPEPAKKVKKAPVTREQVSNGNGNGKVAAGKSAERPFDAETIRDMLRRKAAGNDKRKEAPATELDKMVAPNLERLFPKDYANDRRKAVTEYVFGVNSTKDLTPGQKLALLNWANVIQDADSQEWIPDLMAIHEGEAMVKARALEAGQGELLPETDPETEAS